MKKLLISSLVAGLLSTSAMAWDFCSDESQVAIDVTSMGIGTAVLSSVSGGVPGLIVGAIANQMLCNEVKSSDNIPSAVKDEVAVKRTTIADAKDVYFDFDKYSLNAKAKADVTVDAQVVKTLNKPIVIEGNADSRGSDEYNYALGLKRAQAVKTELINAGVTSELQVISYGEANPACTEGTEDCFAKNRRVQIKEIK